MPGDKSSDKQMESETEVVKKKLSNRKYFIGPIIFINIYAFFLPSIILPQYGFQAFQKNIFPNHTFASGEQNLCNTNTSNEEYKNQQTVTTETATWNLYNSLASCLPAVISNFLFGSYSDQYGRKLFLFLSTSGSFLKISFCCLGAYLEWDIYYFILFYALDGMTGMWICFITISYSYVADITREGKSRTFAIVLVELCVGLAAVSASVTSGYFVRNFGFALPLATCAGLLLLEMILLICFLPETVQKQKNGKRINVKEQVKRVFRFYFKDNPASGGYRWKFILCILIFILVSHSVLGRGVETLYQLNTPFCWSSVFIGWYTTITTVVQNVVGIAIAKILQNYLSELSIAIIAMLSFTSGFLLEGFASNDIELFLAPAVGVGAVLTNPMLRGYMSKMTPSDQQGAMFSGLAALESVCSLTASSAANGLFAATLPLYRGTIFFIFSGYNIIAICLLVILKICSKPEDKRGIKEITHVSIGGKKNVE